MFWCQAHFRANLAYLAGNPAINLPEPPPLNNLAFLAQKSRIRGLHYPLDSLRHRLTSSKHGRLAQLVERFVYTEDVGGSSPSSPTMHPFLDFEN